MVGFENFDFAVMDRESTNEERVSTYKILYDMYFQMYYHLSIYDHKEQEKLLQSFWKTLSTLRLPLYYQECDQSTKCLMLMIRMELYSLSLDFEKGNYLNSGDTTKDKGLAMICHDLLLISNEIVNMVNITDSTISV